MIELSTTGGPSPVAPGNSEKGMREAAIELEAVFLAEMLKSAGMGEARTSLGGGVGEDQFSSFLIREQALQMARTGGVGLSETLFHALAGRGNG